MNISIFLILFSFIFLSFNNAQARGIPYCSKKVVRGCVQAKVGQVAKTYYAPKYKESYSSTKVKPRLNKIKSKKLAKNFNNKKITKPKRGTASTINLKLKKKKNKKLKI